MPFQIRPYQSDDLASLYEICLQTADAGKDASHLFSDRALIGSFYSAPYAALEAEVCFVVTHENTVCGYIVGCKSSSDFSAQCESQWFPTFRARYPLNSESHSLLNSRLLTYLHSGYQPRPEFSQFPAHLHINLLANTQGHGLGAKLMTAFIDNLKNLQVVGLHLEVSRDNLGAICFYEKMGFEIICEFEHSIGYGMYL